MRWYQTLRTAHKPPAYFVERISDLNHASEVSEIAPSNARSILQGVISQLESHMDDEYVDDLKMASDILLDNPKKARSLIGLVVAFMQADKSQYDLEKHYPWQARKFRQ